MPFASPVNPLKFLERARGPNIPISAGHRVVRTAPREDQIPLSIVQMVTLGLLGRPIVLTELGEERVIGCRAIGALEEAHLGEAHRHSMATEDVVTRIRIPDVTTWRDILHDLRLANRSGQR